MTAYMRSRNDVVEMKDKFSGPSEHDPDCEVVYSVLEWVLDPNVSDSQLIDYIPENDDDEDEEEADDV